MPGGHNVLNKFGTLLGIGSVTLYFIILTLIMLNPDKMSSVVTIKITDNLNFTFDSQNPK